MPMYAKYQVPLASAARAPLSPRRPSPLRIPYACTHARNQHHATHVATSCPLVDLVVPRVCPHPRPPAAPPGRQPHRQRAAGGGPQQRRPHGAALALVLVQQVLLQLGNKTKVGRGGWEAGRERRGHLSHTVLHHKRVRRRTTCEGMRTQWPSLRIRPDHPHTISAVYGGAPRQPTTPAFTY